MTLAPLSLPSALSVASPVKPGLLAIIICNHGVFQAFFRREHFGIRVRGAKAVAERAASAAPCIRVWSRVRLTSPPPAATISTSVAQTSSAPSSRFAECPKEFREAAVRDVEFQRFLVVPVHLERHLAFGDFGRARRCSAAHLRRGLPSTLLAHGGEQLLRECREQRACGGSIPHLGHKTFSRDLPAVVDLQQRELVGEEARRDRAFELDVGHRRTDEVDRQHVIVARQAPIASATACFRTLFSQTSRGVIVSSPLSRRWSARWSG